MKVLFVLHTTQMHGSTLSLLNLAEGLIGKGVEVAVAGPELHEELSQRLNSLGIGYYPVRIAQSVYPQQGRLYLGRLLNLLKRKHNSLNDIQRVAETVKPDIIHTNTGVIREGYRVAKKLAIPHVWHLREYQDKDFGWKCFPSKSDLIKHLKQSHVITVTDDIRDYYDLTDYSKAQTIYNGVCYRDGEERKVPREPFFLSATRISPEKGFEDLLQAFTSFNKQYPSFRLVILGDGEQQYIDSLTAMAQDLGCSDAIDWKGYTTEVMPYIQRATALIAASRCEGFGRMTAEACCAGSMVIGRNSGGTREILEATGGLLFNDNQELLHSMLEVASMPQSAYEEKAYTVQQQARRLYSIEGNVDKIYGLYQKILTDE